MADEPTQPQADDQPQADEPSQEETKVEEPEKETPKAPETETTEDAPSKTESETTEPTEPKEESGDDAEASKEEPKAQSRYERRQERKERYFDSIRRDHVPSYQQAPVDYEPPAQDPDLFDPERDAKAAQAAAQQVKYQAEQDNFRQAVELEKAKVEADPEFSWMKENSVDFDPERVEALNDRFMAMVGYREVPSVDPATGQVVYRGEAANTSISYEKFVRNEVALWNRIAEERAEQMAKNTASQKATQGARPSGTERAPDLSDPNVVANLSPEEFKKYEPRIMKLQASLPPK